MLVLSKSRIIQPRLTIATFLNCVFLINCYSDFYSNEYISHQKDEDIQIIDVSAPRPGWIDPFDMLGDNRDMPEDKGMSSDLLFTQSDVEKNNLKKRLVKCEIYLQRFVNLLLRTTKLQDSTISTDSSQFVNLEFYISGRDLDVLRAFGQYGYEGARIESVSSVIDNIFEQNKYQKQHHSSLHQSLNWLKNVAIKLLTSPEWVIIFSVSITFLSTLWFVYITHSYHLALFCLLLTIFFSGYGFTWIRLYEEKEIERYANFVRHGNVPHHCSAQNMKWYEHMYYRIFGEDCLQFYKVRDVNPMVKISPIEVLIETVSAMIITPAKHIGTAYGSFVKSLIEVIPWWLKPIAVPVSFIVPLLFFIVPFILISLLIFNYRLSISWTGFHIMPSSSHSHIPAQNKDAHYVEEISHIKNTTSQQLLLDHTSPVFTMNWEGLRKLSSTVIIDKSNSIDKEATNSNINESHNLNKDCTESADEIKGTEEPSIADENISLLNNAIVETTNKLKI